MKSNTGINQNKCKRQQEAVETIYKSGMLFVRTNEKQHETKRLHFFLKIKKENHGLTLEGILYLLQKAGTLRVGPQTMISATWGWGLCGRRQSFSSSSYNCL